MNCFVQIPTRRYDIIRRALRLKVARQPKSAGSRNCRKKLPKYFSPTRGKSYFVPVTIEKLDSPADLHGANRRVSQHTRISLCNKPSAARILVGRTDSFDHAMHGEVAVVVEDDHVAARNLACICFSGKNNIARSKPRQHAFRGDS